MMEKQTDILSYAYHMCIIMRVLYGPVEATWFPEPSPDGILLGLAESLSTSVHTAPQSSATQRIIPPTPSLDSHRAVYIRYTCIMEY